MRSSDLLYCAIRLAALFCASSAVSIAMGDKLRSLALFGSVGELAMSSKLEKSAQFCSPAVVDVGSAFDAMSSNFAHESPPLPLVSMATGKLSKFAKSKRESKVNNVCTS